MKALFGFLVSISMLILICTATSPNDPFTSVNNNFIEGNSIDFDATIQQGFARYPLGFVTTDAGTSGANLEILDLEKNKNVAFQPDDVALVDSPQEISFGIVPTHDDEIYFSDPSIFTNQSFISVVGLKQSIRGAVGMYFNTWENVSTTILVQNYTEITYPNGTFEGVFGDPYNVTTWDLKVKVAKIGLVDRLQILQAGVADWKNQIIYAVGVIRDPTLYKIDITPSGLNVSEYVVLDDVGFVQSMHLDAEKQLLYLLSDNSLFRMNLTTFSIESSLNLTVVAPKGVQSAVFDFSKQFAAIAAAPLNSTSSVYLFQVNLGENSMSINFGAANLTLNGFIAARVAFLDESHGYSYFISFNSIGRVARINMRTFTVSESYRLTQMSRVTDGFHDIMGRAVYMINTTVIGQLYYPAPCKSDCLGQGQCDYGVCRCDIGWDGVDCGLLGCTPYNNSCYSRGVCNNGSCLCIPGYTGQECTIETCPKDCSGQGSCNMDTHVCSCNIGFEGEDCAIVLDYIPCHLSKNSSVCSKNPECVWCSSNSKCLIGNRDGPRDQYCSDWHYMDRKRIELTIIEAIFIAITGILILVNIYSAIMEDLGGELAVKGSNNVRASWWRSLRSARAWAILEQFQLVAMTGLIGFHFPTSYMTFTRIFNWSLLSFALPWEDSKKVQNPAGRDLANFEQHASNVEAETTKLFLGTILMFAFLLAALCIVRLIILFVKKQYFAERWIYMLNRLLMFSQMGMLVAASYTIAKAGKLHDSEWVGFALAIITIIFFGLVMPLGWLIYFMKIDKKSIFIVDYRKRLGCLYESFTFNKCWFIGIVLIKRSIISMAIGFISVSGIASTVVSLVTLVAYGVSILVFRPFLDIISYVVELAVVVVDIIMFGLIFAFTKNEETPLAITYLILALQCCAWAILIVSYFYLWMRMRNFQTMRQLFSGLLHKQKYVGNPAN